MGTVYKESFTKPLPAGVRIIVRKGKQLAEWKDAKGKTRTAPLTAAGDRIAVEAGTYTAKYRDGSGIVRKVSTGCRDKTAAESVLADLVRRAELVKAGVFTGDEDAVADHQATPLADHFAAFIDHQRAKGVVPVRINNTLTQLQRVAADCGFSTLADLDTVKLERWLLGQESEGMSAGTRNQYRGAWVTFCNWCIWSNPPQLISNPFVRLPKADEKADPRRKRRSLTEDELVKLLDVARRRPLLDMMTVRRGKRRGEAFASLRDETRYRLEMLGWERALIYTTLVLTGLRKGELASLSVGQLDLDANPPYLVLDAADEKNRQGTTIPLRADLAADLREWLAYKLARLQDAATNAPAVPFDPGAGRGDFRGAVGPTLIPSRLPADTPLFCIPAGLLRILNRDLKAAGIPKRDERGRTLDVHAMRTTLGTLLSKDGVAPRTAQAAMRHSKIDLTMNVYTDPKLLDVAGAMEALPSLPLSAGPQWAANALSPTGTDGSPLSPLVPVLVPTTGKSSTWQSILDRATSNRGEAAEAGAVAVSAYPVKRKDPLTTPVNGSSEWAAPGSNWRPLPCEDSALTN
jgi:integrase